MSRFRVPMPKEPEKEQPIQYTEQGLTVPDVKNADRAGLDIRMVAVEDDE